MLTHQDFVQSSGAIWRDRFLTAGAAVVIGITLSGPAPADEMSSQKRAANLKYDQTVRQAKADYKAARAHCNKLSGNDKDVCVEKAKAR